MVALHARRSTVVISAEDAVIFGIAALLKPRISQARPAPPAIEIRRLASESPATGPKPAGDLTIGIRYAQPMFRVVRPRRPAKFSVEFTKAVTMEEGIIDE